MSKYSKGSQFAINSNPINQVTTIVSEPRLDAITIKKDDVDVNTEASILNFIGGDLTVEADQVDSNVVNIEIDVSNGSFENNFVTGATFTGGILTLTRDGLTDVDVSLDGRYALSGDVFSGNYGDLTGAPTTVSSFTNDAGYLTSVPTEYLTETEGDARYLQSIAANSIGITELDVTDGTNGQVLTTNGAGVLSFSTVSAGGSNFYLDGATFNTSDGVLTLSVNGAADQTVDLDGRYALSGDVFSGNYGDLTGAPTAVSSFTNDAGYLTSIPAEYLTETEGDARYLQSIAANSIGITELDVTDGTNGQVLTTNGAGVLSFSTVSAGGSNFYLDGASFNTGDGVLTLNVNGTTDQTVDLDGRYALTGDVFSGNYGDLTGAPTTVSSFTNDSGYITGYTVTESDVTTHEAALTINDTQIDNTVYDLTGTALVYSNGSIQRKTLSGAVTLTDSLNTGEVILLTLVNNGTHAVTFPTITWITSDSTAPTAAGDDSYVIWKEGTTLYGAYVGYA